MADAAAEIEALYAQIPAFACKGLCQNSCGPIDMSTLERARVTALGVEIPAFTPERARAFAAGAPIRCPALGMFGQCTVYDVRPLICRLWGATESMRCEHGCRPVQLLTHAQAMRLIAEAMAIGGHDRDWGGPEQIRARQALLEADPELMELMERYTAANDARVHAELRPAIEARMQALLADRGEEPGQF